MTFRSTSVGIIVLLYGLFSIYMILIYRMEPLYAINSYSSKHFRANCVNRTEVLDRLTEFQRAFHKEKVPETLRQKLKALLDFCMEESGLNEPTGPSCSGRDCVPDANIMSTSQELLEVCPEKWTGRGDNLYYLDTWKTQNCTNVLPFSRVLTVLLYPSPFSSGNRTCSEHVNNVVTGLRKTYGEVHVLVASVGDFCKVQKGSPHVQYVTVTSDASTHGQVWNSLVAKATTPYVLVARDLGNFMWFTDLKRLVRILSQNKIIQIAGGAVRNRTGHWRVGCYQSSSRNYILEYQEGYYTSKNDCMFCDYLLGPFVARTPFLRRNPFHESLPNENLFEDFFLRIKQSHHPVVNCPDVMFFASDPVLDAKLRNKSVWLPLVRKWELNRVVVPPNRVFAYSCEESELKCDITKLVESFAMPICCVEQFTRAAVIMDKFCRRHKIPYEFAGGTVMGIVKMGDVMPWDHDGDLFYLGNYTIFKKFKEEFAKQGVSVGKLTVVKNEYRWSYFTPDIVIDMSGCVQMSYDSLEDKMFREVPTQALLHGHWVYVMPNPGGYSRNNYGYETLKHAHHFQLLKQKFELPYKGGHFRKCDHPSHHACLKHVATDGSLQFRVPN